MVSLKGPIEKAQRRMDLVNLWALAEKAEEPLDDEWLEREHTEAPDGVQPFRRFLYHLILQMGYKVCLGIGVETGITSAHMVAATEQNGGVAVGIDRNFYVFLWRMAERYPRYRFVSGDSVRMAHMVESYIRGVGLIDLVFQDSSHHFQKSCDEWDTYRPMMSDNGVWVCDDITPAFHDPKIDPPGMGMVQYFESRPGEKYRLDDLNIGNTIGVIVL